MAVRGLPHSLVEAKTQAHARRARARPAATTIRRARMAAPGHRSRCSGERGRYQPVRRLTAAARRVAPAFGGAAAIGAAGAGGAATAGRGGGTLAGAAGAAVAVRAAGAVGVHRILSVVGRRAKPTQPGRRRLERSGYSMRSEDGMRPKVRRKVRLRWAESAKPAACADSVSECPFEKAATARPRRSQSR